MEPKLEESIKRLQAIEENLNNYLAQKQQVQAQLLELESAVAAVGKSETAYKIVGSIMVERKSADLKTELSTEMEQLKTRIDAFEKQENKLKEQAESLQQNIMKDMKKE